MCAVKYTHPLGMVIKDSKIPCFMFCRLFCGLAPHIQNLAKYEKSLYVLLELTKRSIAII